MNQIFLYNAKRINLQRMCEGIVIRGEKEEGGQKEISSVALQ